MKVDVNVSLENMTVNEAFEGNTADEIVGKMKALVAKKMNFALRMIVNGMTNLAFSQEVVRRYNESQKTNLPIPTSCQNFLELAQQQGIAKIL